jgi:hypothetical protein
MGKIVFAVLMFLAWQWRKHEARKRLREMDEGRRCVACERTETSVVDGVVHCALCNHREVLAYVRAVQLTERELNDMTSRPSDRHG